METILFQSEWLDHLCDLLLSGWDYAGAIQNTAIAWRLEPRQIHELEGEFLSLCQQRFKAAPFRIGDRVTRLGYSRFRGTVIAVSDRRCLVAWEETRLTLGRHKQTWIRFSGLEKQEETWSKLKSS